MELTNTLEFSYATKSDKPYWFTPDKHIQEHELDLKFRDKRAYVLHKGNKPIGIVRYNLFWDNIPFLTLIHIEEPHHGMGYGKQFLLHWESEMRKLGYKMVMTSTQVDEQAQHFYSKLGYIARGSLSFDGMPFEQPMEMIMIKPL